MTVAGAFWEARLKVSAITSFRSQSRLRPPGGFMAHFPDERGRRTRYRSEPGVSALRRRRGCTVPPLPAYFHQQTRPPSMSAYHP